MSDSLGKTAPTGPTDVYRLRSPRFTMPTMLKFTEMEAPNESEQLMQESIRTPRLEGWETPPEMHPFFFLEAIYSSSWNSLLIPWSSSWWCHWEVGR